MSVVHQRGPARIEANMTPMIDVTFLLIVFFVLVSQIVETDRVDLEPPGLEQPASVLPGDGARVVVNIVPGLHGGVSGYRVGGRDLPASVEGREAMAAALLEQYRVNPSLRVNVRADRETHFEFVQPVMEAVTWAAQRATAEGKRAGDGQPVFPRINLVVIRED